LSSFKKYFYVIPAQAAFIVYLITLAPGVLQIDSGELAAVQATLGIAHPTGYPLFTIVGYLFSILPLPFTIIYKLNLLAAIFCAGGIYLFALTSRELLLNVSSFQTSSKKIKKDKIKKQRRNKSEINIAESVSEIPQIKIVISITAASLILAFSQTYWLQSTSVEVYSLHIFLILLIIFSLVKAYLKKENDLVHWLWFSGALALGFSNHMTTLLILPGAAYLFFMKNGFNKTAFKKIGLMLLIFVPLLVLIYSYLPLRAAQNPVINWGNPIDFERLMRHISGKQYQVWLFSSSEAAKQQLIYFFENLFREFNIGIFICIFGIVSSYLISKRAFVFLLISLFSTILYSINYDIADIDSYFLLAYISLGFFSLFGIVKLLSILKFNSSVNNYSYKVSAILIAVFVLLQFYLNLGKADKSDTYTFQDYTKAVLTSTGNNALILSYQWDYLISPSYYFQFVEGYKRNTAIVDKELLRRSWYYKQLETAYPGILSGIKNDVDLFLNALKPFESGDEYNSVLLENLYQRIMAGILSSNINKKDIFIGPEIFEVEMQQGSFKLPDGYTLIPDLFLFRVTNSREYFPAADPNFKIRLPETKNYYINMIENFTGSMLVRRAVYEMQFDKVERAKLYLQKVKTDLPDYKIPHGLESLLAD